MVYSWQYRPRWRIVACSWWKFCFWMACNAMQLVILGGAGANGFGGASGVTVVTGERGAVALNPETREEDLRHGQPFCGRGLRGMPVTRTNRTASRTRRSATRL